MSSLKGKFNTSRGEKNHMGLQRKANKPDCGAQPVEQLLFCPCGKFPDSSHQPTTPRIILLLKNDLSIKVKTFLDPL